MNAKLLEIQQTSASAYWCSGSGSGFSGNATSGNSWSAHASEAGAFSRSAVTQIDWSYQNGSYSAVGNVHTDFDASGEYAYSGENDSWWSESNSHSSGWYSFDDDNHNERESNETMVFHHERDENYEWSLDETGRVYVSGYSYTQSGSMSANGHRGGSGTYNYESSSYTQGNGWSSFYHSGSFGSSSFYDEYDFTADWSESFDGVTNSYSSAHSASNNVEGDNYSLSGYFSDYYKTWDGQSPDSGGYSDSYPSSSPYASTVTDNGFSFTWSGHDIMSRQGVYLHNAPYSGMWEIPYGLGTWSNPVEQPSSAWPTDPETPESYTTPSQSYVDDLDAFFYGYDNSDLYETAVQMATSVTITTPSSQQVTYAYSGTSNSDLELVGDPLSDSEAEALFGPDYTPTGNYDHIWDVLFDIMDSASENIMTTLSDAERASLADAVENTLTGTSPPEEPSQTHSRTWGEFFWENIHFGLDVAGLVPGFGEFADGTNALLYLSEGNYTEAGLSAAAMVPIGGTGVTAAKWTKNGIEAARSASNFADTAKSGEKIAGSVTDAAELTRDSQKPYERFHGPQKTSMDDGFTKEMICLTGLLRISKI